MKRRNNFAFPDAAECNVNANTRLSIASPACKIPHGLKIDAAKRPHRSYIVNVNGKLYWPLMKNLKLKQ